MAATIRDIWREAGANEDVRELLLQVVQQGIDGCADLAAGAARDTGLPDHQRIIAVSALVACGRDNLIQEIAASITNDPAVWPDSVVCNLADALFPSSLSATELIALVERSTQDGAHAGWASALRSIASTIDPISTAAVELRNLLADLIWRGREEDDWYRMDGRFNHLAPALALLCDRQLSGDHTAIDMNLIHASVVAAKFGEEGIDRRNALAALRNRFSETAPERRRTAFLEQLAFLESVSPGDKPVWQRLRQTLHDGAVDQLTQADRGWLEAIAADANAQISARVVALEAVLVLWAQRGRSEAELELLVKATAGAAPELTAVVAAWTALPPPPDPRVEEMEREHERHRAQARQREEQRLHAWREWRARLTANPEESFGPTRRQETIGHLYEWLHSRDRASNRFNAWDRGALVQAFGEGVAQRATVAFREYWRTDTPPLWNTRPEGERNTTLTRWVWGLSGLSAEAEDPGWAARLSEEEARVAAAYAPIELNGFPSWLRELVAAHPAAVDAVLGEELTSELSVAAEYQHLPVAQNVAHGDEGLKRLLDPRVLVAITAWPSTFATDQARTFSAHHLEAGLRILDDGASGPDRALVAAECERRVSADPVGPLANIWLRGLFRFDPSRAAAALENAFAAVPENERQSYAIETFAVLVGDRDGGALLGDMNPADRTNMLASLIHLAHTFVRPEDDQHHQGVYSPNQRDRAQSARGFLMGALLETPGPEAQRALLSLADGILSAYSPDRVRQLARERAAQDADAATLDAAAVRALEERYEAPPSDRDGLFAVMVDRLDDLERDLAHHDFTNRRTWRSITEEIEMQRSLALRFEEAARGAYTVSREAEVADRKEPDIRLAAVQGHQKASIEVKIADSWTVAELELALTSQLVGQYLRHEDSKAGCLLLTYNGTKGYWEHPDTGAHLRFGDLIEYLAGRARAIEEQMNHNVRIVVYGIDLTDPPLAPTR